MPSGLPRRILKEALVEDFERSVPAPHFSPKTCACHPVPIVPIAIGIGTDPGSNRKIKPHENSFPSCDRCRIEPAGPACLPVGRHDNIELPAPHFRQVGEKVINETASEKCSACSIYKLRPHQAVTDNVNKVNYQLRRK
jgi:hypothetical protein